jgi:predicted esterase
MRPAERRAPHLLAAISCGLVVATGCRHSVVWLGDASRDAGVQAQAADGGIAQRVDAQAVPSDASVELSTAQAEPQSLPGDAATPGAGQDAMSPQDPAQTPSTGAASAMPQATTDPNPSVNTTTSPTAGASATPAADGGIPAPTPRLPKGPASCPPIRSGTLRFGDIDVQIRAGTPIPGKPGPLLIYWHGTGSSPSEINGMLHDALDEIPNAGGMIAAPASTSGRGRSTVTDTWYDGDLDAIDELVACAVAQQIVDPDRIYAAGCSSGAVQAGMMAFLRSEYLAAAMLNSGGIVESYALSEPTHVPAVITAHGSAQSDVVIVNFSEASQRLTKDIAAQTGFAVDCDHGGGHCGAPAELVNAQWQFLKAHTFGVRESPYVAGLPASFPSYCKIVGD